MMHVSAAMVMVNGFSGAETRDAPAPTEGFARRARWLEVSPQIRHQFRPQSRPEFRPEIARPEIARPEITGGAIARWLSALHAAHSLRQERRHLALHIARLAECSPHLLDDIGVIARTGDSVELAAEPDTTRP